MHAVLRLTVPTILNVRLINKSHTKIRRGGVHPCDLKIAFVEHCFQPPANRRGYYEFTPAQLKRSAHHHSRRVL